MKVLSAKGLSRTYLERGKGGACRALDSVSLEIEAGEFAAVMGPSGSGKTTLLAILALLDRPDSGELSISGADALALRGDALAAFRRERLGFVFQDSQLIDTMTLAENALLPLALGRCSGDEAAARLDRLSRRLGIDSLLGRYPSEVSGGQRQRAAALRALICGPRLLVADEPTGALDSRSGRELMELFGSLGETEGSAVLMATHDPFAASWARRVFFLRDGRFLTQIARNGGRRDFFDRIIEIQAATEREGS
ncbi:MAG TPA: ABC transporter ATP-binding protein [Spirochaetales bacterium]|nr:ABC transporter ATP-binding protein [Spirochaetales bacterium]HRY55441.1 ABC transporter ATP-binding protein [Spirochaetia bacterium]HRZ64741.1 ABC transporter ATP-binding protein [Spirochaetia bacterium]